MHEYATTCALHSFNCAALTLAGGGTKMEATVLVADC
jgi:hypothetical protein